MAQHATSVGKGFTTMPFTAKKIGLMLATTLMSLAIATEVNAKSRESFTVGWGGVNASSETKCFEALCVNIVVNRVNVNGDKNEICAVMANGSGTKWSGGFRLTQRDDLTTHMILKVAAEDTVRRCEILPRDSQYWVVLRNDQ